MNFELLFSLKSFFLLIWVFFVTFNFNRYTSVESLSQTMFLSYLKIMTILGLIVCLVLIR